MGTAAAYLVFAVVVPTVFWAAAAWWMYQHRRPK